MSDSFLPYQDPSVVDKKLDSESLTVGANTVHRERVEVSGAGAAEIAEVKNAAPTTEYGLITRNIPSGVQVIEFDKPATSGYTEASISAASSGENVLVAGTASQTIRVFAIFLIAAAAVDIKFKDAASGTDLTGAMSLAAKGGMVLDPMGEPWFKTATAGAFILNLSAAVQVSGRIYYTKSA